MTGIPTEGIARVSHEKPPHWSAREVAKIIGVSEHAMSARLTEKRKPGLESIMRIAGLYDIDPRLLTGDPLAFRENQDRFFVTA